MKRIIIVIISILAISATNMFAQFGFDAGYLHSETLNKEVKKKPLDGFYAGLSYNIRLGSVFSLSPGLRYSFGSRSDGEMSFLNITAKKSTQEHLIEMPISLRITIPLGKSSGLVIYGRPTLSYGISGEISYEFSRESQKDPLLSYKYDYFNGKATANNIPDEVMTMINDSIDKDFYRRYDVMLGAGAGFIFGNICIIHAGYDWGMLNRYSDESNGTIKRNVLHVGATFLF